MLLSVIDIRYSTLFMKTEIFEFIFFDAEPPFRF